MNLNFKLELSAGYTSQSQRIRVLTETWVTENSYCPSCGYKKLLKYGNNNPAADFYCSNCEAEFELKSTKNNFAKKINDGAYKKMMGKIYDRTNPNFFFLNYTNRNSVYHFFTIPKHFFMPAIIEKRKPLSQTARRAGWIGCNILLSNLPLSGRIYLIRDGQIINHKNVIKQWERTLFLKDSKIENKSWLIEIMSIVDKLQNDEFSLSEIYQYENYLKNRFPKNNFIKEKIRQQLQVLRDNNYIKFIDKGKYQKV